MQVIIYQMRKNGIEVARDLLGDEPRHIGELCIGIIEEGPRKRQVKVARLQRDNGEDIIKLLDVQIEAIKAGRLVLKGIERRQMDRGEVEYAQGWLCVQAGTPLLDTSRERFFKKSGGDRH